jgi:hypothetical protein
MFSTCSRRGKTTYKEHAEMSPEEMPVQLSPGKVNLVGEDHRESSGRRPLERGFVLAKLGGDAGYWTEEEFPDRPWQPRSMSRRARGGAGGEGGPSADPMEYRAAQAAITLLENFRTLCDSATLAGAHDAATPDAPAALAAFADGALRVFGEIRTRARRTWEETDPATVPVSGRDQYVKVNDAVRDAWREIDTIIGNYVQLMREATARRDVENQLRATRTLGFLGVEAPVMARRISDAVGLYPGGDDDPATAEAEVQLQRSRSMGQAASTARMKGVWKVGSQHIDDLKSGRAKVDLSRFTIVTREEFNQALQAWEARPASRPARPHAMRFPKPNTPPAGD